MKKNALLLAAAVLCLWGLWQLAQARTFQLFGALVPRVETQEPVAALTFDDGPTAAYTEAVLALLRERSVKATFFVTGSETEKNITWARRIVAEGHELGNHSYSHKRMLLRSPSFIREEVERTDAAIREAGHRGEIYFRPPYGKRLLLLPLYLARTGRKTIMWDVEPESYPEVGGSAEAIVRHVVQQARPGSIILLHVMYEGRAPSRDALPGIIEGLQQRGYRFVTMSELLSKHM